MVAGVASAAASDAADDVAATTVSDVRPISHYWWRAATIPTQPPTVGQQQRARPEVAQDNENLANEMLETDRCTSVAQQQALHTLHSGQQKCARGEASASDAEPSSGGALPVQLPTLQKLYQQPSQRRIGWYQRVIALAAQRRGTAPA